MPQRYIKIILLPPQKLQKKHSDNQKKQKTLNIFLFFPTFLIAYTKKDTTYL